MRPILALALSDLRHPTAVRDLASTNAVPAEQGNAMSPGLRIGIHLARFLSDPALRVRALLTRAAPLGESRAGTPAPR
ncbi:MAG: hypothetical protein KJZ59_00950 [Pararhodobacter sp.]|nr:hypothetical protein [Pararhodobacter sp.]